MFNINVGWKVNNATLLSQVVATENNNTVLGEVI